MPLVRFKQATLGYGAQPVLRDVTFDVASGFFMGILGPNGAGKTTILKTILGLIPCMDGEFSRHGAHGGLRYGYVPQKEKLNPLYPLSAYDIAAMGTYQGLAPLQRLRGVNHRALIEHSLAVCGASALAKKRYSSLSGGQKQRVLIARALASKPELLVLDEPLAGIDITTQKALIELLHKLREDNKLTTLMVSHRIEAEKNLFTHIAWVDEGRAVVGATRDMLATGKVREVFQSEL